MIFSFLDKIYSLLKYITTYYLMVQRKIKCPLTIIINSTYSYQDKEAPQEVLYNLSTQALFPLLLY